MATASFIVYIADQAQLQDRLTHKKMFGEYALYLDGKVIALACDNSLFIKPADATHPSAADLPQCPPYPAARPYPVADALLDEPHRLRELLLPTERATSAPNPRAPKKHAAR